MNRFLVSRISSASRWCERERAQHHARVPQHALSTHWFEIYVWFHIQLWVDHGYNSLCQSNNHNRNAVQYHDRAHFLRSWTNLSISNKQSRTLVPIKPCGTLLFSAYRVSSPHAFSQHALKRAFPVRSLSVHSEKYHRILHVPSSQSIELCRYPGSIRDSMIILHRM